MDVEARKKLFLTTALICCSNLKALSKNHPEISERRPDVRGDRAQGIGGEDVEVSDMACRQGSPQCRWP